MEERLRRHLQDESLIPAGSRVLVGYSGGADSTCLLHLLHQLGFAVVAAHLHHGMRPEADEELEKCGAVCEASAIPFVAGRADVPRLASDTGVGLEEAGRNARYGFFREAAARSGCSPIATGHTQTDHVETVLLNLTRGCGLSGLSGIPQSRDGIVRPLLIFRRDETTSYCQEQGLWTHDDPANFDPRFARSRIRSRVVPELRSINSNFEAAAARLAALAEEEDRFLDGLAAAALERAEIPLNGELRFLTEDCEIAFSSSGLGALPAVLFRRAVRLAAGALGAALDSRQVGQIAGSFSNGESGSVTAEGGEVALEWDSDTLRVRQLAPVEPFRYPLAVPGETESPAFGWVFAAEVARAERTAQKRAELCVEIDPGAVSGPLHYRTAEPGDAIRPLGFKGERKLSDVLSEAGLTPAARKRLPIVCDIIGPVWAPGVCLAERVKSGAGAGDAIRIRFAPLNRHNSESAETHATR